MASIKTALRGYICDEREKNWSREYASREIARHKEKLILDHPDESVTTAKLKDACVTENKLSDTVLGKFSQMNAGLEILQSALSTETAARKTADSKKADASDVYTKSDIESRIMAIYEEFVSQGQFNSIVSGIDKIADKADKATTLSGYGIKDAYTKTEIDAKVGDIETALDNIIALQNGYIPQLFPGGGVDT